MKSLLNNRITYVWLCLAVLTGLSWLLADGLAPTTDNGVVYLALGLLALAFFKIRLVVMHFMELKNAPWVLRGIFELWVVVVLLALCGLYVLGASA